MKFTRRRAVYSLLNHRRKYSVLEELKADPVGKQKLHSINKTGYMEDIRYSKQLLDYRPVGRRTLERPLKRLLDAYQKFLSLHHCIQTESGTHQPPIQWVPGALPKRAKRLWREADRIPPSSAEVKNLWSYTSTPPRLHGEAPI
jgi:hypothetical protein